ncbi:MAG: hypothetical protein HYV07_09670, partial [Deltaproteobacteria bacterium]|nr:hypothetical protein [Deltaproteobacteria bacterium]
MRSSIEWTLVDGSSVAELGDYALEVKLCENRKLGPPEDFVRWWDWNVTGYADGDS